jgi:N utilization substance protein A
MLKRLFEIEVPEVYNGVVEIKAIARDAGFRSKVAVNATQQGIDPVGSCIGVRGNRIQSIVNELQGEKIDVVAWDKDPKVFIAKALSPSEVVEVEFSSDGQTATVVVPDRQLSLAIGKEGQNTRLAARLTGYRLDIKGMTEWEQIREARQLQLALAQKEKALAEAEAGIQTEEPAATLATEPAPVIDEIVVAVEEAVAEPVVTAPAEPEPAPAEVAEVLNEEQLLEALIREEEDAAPAVAAAGTETGGLSVEELQAFTLDDVEPLEGDEEDEEDELPELPEMPALPDLAALAPDAGKIRFAEDLIDDVRGARTGRRGRRGGGARGGARGGR